MATLSEAVNVYFMCAGPSCDEVYPSDLVVKAKPEQLDEKGYPRCLRCNYSTRPIDKNYDIREAALLREVDIKVAPAPPEGYVQRERRIVLIMRRKVAPYF